MVEVLAELRLLDEGREVLAGRHQEADIRVGRQAGGRGLVQRSCKARSRVVEIVGERGDVVEEERAPLGLGELVRPVEADLGAHRRGPPLRAAARSRSSMASSSAAQSTVTNG